MAKLNAKNLGTVMNVAKKSDEKSQILSLKILEDVNLVDYPRNNEDISNTVDLELSIKQNGFTDPIEVTDFGMDDGKYTIVSGHRRRSAGKKCGLTKFPCIIKHFDSEQDVYNYVLLSNSQRDSAKDPLLYCKRYKMHEEYLKETGFTGSYINEIANRIGLSPQQAERYDRFNRIIMPCWDLVREEKVGMSSLLPMATMGVEEQTDIYNVIVKCIENGIDPTRARCKQIIEKYKAGARGYENLVLSSAQESIRKSELGVAVMSGINVEPSETAASEEPEEPLRNGEVNYDNSSREMYSEDTEKHYEDEKLSEEDYAAIEGAVENAKKENAANASSPEDFELRYKKGEMLHKNLSQSLVTLGKGYYDFRDTKEKEGFVELLALVIEMASTELYDLSTSKDEGIGSKCKELLAKNKDTIEKICKSIGE